MGKDPIEHEDSKISRRHISSLDILKKHELSLLAIIQAVQVCDIMTVQ